MMGAAVKMNIDNNPLDAAQHASDVTVRLAVERSLEKLEFVKAIVSSGHIEGLDVPANQGLQRILNALDEDLKIVSENL